MQTTRGNFEDNKQERMQSDVISALSFHFIQTISYKYEYIMKAKRHFLESNNVAPRK
jgi:hypothetical protein